MKLRLLLFLVLSLPSPAPAQGIGDGNKFLEEIKMALSAQDKAKLGQLTYTEGMSEADKVQWSQSTAHLFSSNEIESLAFAPLPKPVPRFFIVKGRKFEPTAPPSGMVNISYKSSSNSNTGAALTYTVVNGSYWLISSKSTDLNWKGPEDVNIGFRVIGNGQDKVSISGKYNASGIDLEQQFESPSATLWGQYFSEITVHSTDPACEVSLTVMENGREIYKSETLKGAGEIKYSKGAAPAKSP